MVKYLSVIEENFFVIKRCSQDYYIIIIALGKLMKTSLT